MLSYCTVAFWNEICLFGFWYWNNSLQYKQFYSLFYFLLRHQVTSDGGKMTQTFLLSRIA
jgi:hypothetical protein